jgi:hypothetical protein
MTNRVWERVSQRSGQNARRQSVNFSVTSTGGNGLLSQKCYERIECAFPCSLCQFFGWISACRDPSGNRETTNVGVQESGAFQLEAIADSDLLRLLPIPLIKEKKQFEVKAGICDEFTIVECKFEIAANPVTGIILAERLLTPYGEKRGGWVIQNDESILQSRDPLSLRNLPYFCRV